jgi:nicotinamidase-related amidase
VVLLLIDEQKDFCFPEGSLYVGGRSGRGALDDNDRAARFVYRNLARLSEVVCTLDTHYPFQIFSPSFWLDEGGRPPAPHREVTTEDVRRGRLRPNPDMAALAGRDGAWLQRQVEFYCAELERTGRYTLYLWPPHCLLGSDGHALVGVVHEARLFHAWTRSAPGGIELKGGHALTENYSVLAPEVRRTFEGQPLAERNEPLAERLLAADAVIVAGQAASHCVRSSLDDLMEVVAARDARLASKVYVLRDVMSAVAVPDPARPGAFLADFTPQAEAAFARWAAAGAHVVSAEQPLEAWPAFPA